MITETAKGQSAAPAAASPAAAGAAATPEASFKGHTQPIVVNFKKKKRRYSSSLKGLQKRLRSSSTVSSKLLDAISSGLGKFRKRSDRSSKNKRDGMLKDLLKNSASGLGSTIRKSSKLPKLLAKTINGSSMKRQVRLMKALAGGRR